MSGMAGKMRDLPRALRSFWSYRDKFGIYGILFKGKQVLIPESMSGDILKQPHQGHQGIDNIKNDCT